MKLKELPILPSVHGDDKLMKVYSTELRQVKDEEGLKKFVQRWKAAYSSGTAEEEQMVRGEFDAKLALDCLLKNLVPENNCGHTTPSCYGMHLIFPVPFLMAALKAQTHGVSIDIALIQANGGMAALM